jgi:ProP effector
MSAATARDAKADAALALLCERWPKCFLMFPGRRLPLKIGIHKDIPNGLIEPKILRLALRLYVNNPGYLNAMRLGAARVDLNGEPAGTVGENEAESAQARLNGIWKFEKDRKQRRPEEAAKVATPPPPSPAPLAARRDSLSGLREAARKRRGAA